MADRQSSVDDEPIRLGFVCGRNVARSQTGAAFAYWELERRRLTGRRIHTSGTRLASAAHGFVQTAIQEVSIDI